MLIKIFHRCHKNWLVQSERRKGVFLRVLLCSPKFTITALKNYFINKQTNYNYSFRFILIGIFYPVFIWLQMNKRLQPKCLSIYLYHEKHELFKWSHFSFFSCICFVWLQANALLLYMVVVRWWSYDYDSPQLRLNYCQHRLALWPCI